MDKKKKLYRSTKDKMIAGVCGGLADYFGIDVSIIRVITVILTLCVGGGLLAYIICWIIIKPEDEVKKDDEVIKEK